MSNMHFVRKVLLIQMLLQIARDESQELELWLRARGGYRLGLKQELNALHNQSRKVRNEIYKAMNIEQEQALLDDIDSLYEIFKKDANQFVGLKSGSYAINQKE